MSHINKLSKDDQKRHFANLNGGKGDCMFRGRLGREANNEKQTNYKSNAFWDTTEFQRKQDEKRNNAKHNS